MVEHAKKDDIAILPIGAIEQHGPHCPCGDDDFNLRPANRPGGGAITYFTTEPGKLTLARLYRVDGEYHMAIIEGETVNISQEEYEFFVNARGIHQLPTAFIKMDVDTDELISQFGSNHILAVDGRYTRELVHLCEMLNIPPVLFNRKEVPA